MQLDANEITSAPVSCNNDAAQQRQSYSFSKIALALADELADGGIIEGLRPVEARNRLAARMRLRGMTDAEIPSRRTFARYLKDAQSHLNPASRR